MKERIINNIKGIGYILLTTISLISIVLVHPCFSILAFGTFVYSFYNAMAEFGQPIKNSIFQVNRTFSGKYKINQGSFGKPLRMISCIEAKNKKKKIEEETINAFVELKEKDHRNIKIKYITTSQGITKACLQRAEKYGYIENLDITELKHKRPLITEKLVICNYKTLFKPVRMYKMSFNLTDKQRDKEEIKKIMKK